MKQLYNPFVVGTNATDGNAMDMVLIVKMQLHSYLQLQCFNVATEVIRLQMSKH